MSVCPGAFILAKAGLLDGLAATTVSHRLEQLAKAAPNLRVVSDQRYVDNGKVITTAGLSSGIDLALRVVERYYGREVATSTARQMEYQGEGWLNPNSNEAYAKARVSTDDHPICPVCDMDVDKGTSPKSVYKGKTYYFCMDDHKQAFDAAPESYLNPA